MSRTTSAKFVNLTVYTSLTAQVFNQLLLHGLTWAVICSDIPLVLSTYLLLMIVKCQVQGRFVLPANQGNWFFHRDGVVRSDDQTSLLTQADVSVSGIKVSFELESGERGTIWRDSCTDVQYRQLCLILRQWKMGADAPI
ncbi:protein YgfX [Vibrio alfacsensis]|uniref:protein YgfX n=1 Tax=Vibrio alfacsensis TaxID=1074311 RepID=UPI004068CAE1